MFISDCSKFNTQFDDGMGSGSFSWNMVMKPITMLSWCGRFTGLRPISGQKIDKYENINFLNCMRRIANPFKKILQLQDQGNVCTQGSVGQDSEAIEVKKLLIKNKIDKLRKSEMN